jgi:small subunit ribosomal protein S25
MPFMVGTAPIRRTVQYLEAGKLILKESIQVMSINYNTHGDHHSGIRLKISFVCIVILYFF